MEKLHLNTIIKEKEIVGRQCKATIKPGETYLFLIERFVVGLLFGIIVVYPFVYFIVF